MGGAETGIESYTYVQKTNLLTSCLGAAVVVGSVIGSNIAVLIANASDLNGARNERAQVISETKETKTHPSLISSVCPTKSAGPTTSPIDEGSKMSDAFSSCESDTKEVLVMWNGSQNEDQLPV